AGFARRNDDLARVNADAHRQARRGATLGGLPNDKCGPAGGEGMVFQTIQGAKTRKDAVTSDLDDRATLLADGRRHGVDHRPDAQHGRLSVDGTDGFGRPLDIGEQDGGDLAGGLARSRRRALDLQGVAAFATKFGAPRTGQSAAWAVRPLSCRHFCRYRVTRVWILAAADWLV